MVLKKMTITAVAAMLLLSYAILAIPSDQSDAASDGAGPSVHYGYGASLDAGHLVEFIVDDYGDDMYIPGMGKIDLDDMIEDFMGDDAEDLLEDGYLKQAVIAALRAEGYTDILRCDVNAKGDVYGLFSMTDDSMTKTTAFSGRFTLDLQATTPGGLVMNATGVKLSLDSYNSITASKDVQGELKSLYTSTATTVSLEGDISMSGATGSDIPTVDYPLDMDLAFSNEASVEFDTHISLSDVRDDEITVGAYITVDRGVSSNITGIPNFFESDSLSTTVTVEFDDDEFELDDMGDYVDGMIPDFEFELDVDDDLPTRVQRLDGAALERVQNGINTIRSNVSGNMSDIEVTVTYLNQYGFRFASEDVSLGSVIPDKVLTDVPEGMTFLGWMPEGAKAFKSNVIATSDMTVRPMFAEDLGADVSVGEIGAMIASGKNVLIEMPVDSVTEIPLTGISANYGLVIDVVDGDKKVARWTIIGDTTGCADSVTVKVTREAAPEDMTGVNPVKLSFDASGKMPAGTVVTYNVSDLYNDGSIVEMFHVESDGLNNLVGVSVVDDGYVDIPTRHFSDYILQAQAYQPGSDGNGGSNNTLLIVGGVAAVIVVVGLFMYLRRH